MFKGRRRLVARCTGGATVELRVALGREPSGPKRRSGDLRTPEGSYRISGPARASRFHLFIPIDYPSRPDAVAGLAAGLIDASVFARVDDAITAGRLPPQRTPLGGYIGLHGEGDRWRSFALSVDWTNGCIALRDEDIEFLAERVGVGTPVVIHP